MRRVVISGIGVVSCLGNNRSEVIESLREGRSGISYNESFAEKGLRSSGAFSGKDPVRAAPSFA